MFPALPLLPSPGRHSSKTRRFTQAKRDYSNVAPSVLVPIHIASLLGYFSCKQSRKNQRLTARTGDLGLS